MCVLFCSAGPRQANSVRQPTGRIYDDSRHERKWQAIAHDTSEDVSEMLPKQQTGLSKVRVAMNLKFNE